MATTDEIRRLRKLYEDMELEGREVLWKYTDEELAAIYNGIGPEAFPSWRGQDGKHRHFISTPTRKKREEELVGECHAASVRFVLP